MQTWCSFCRRSIVFKAYSKHFKRETLTTKQHSHHRYHARKRALAQFKQNIISCIDLSQQTQRTSLISSASIHLFNCTYSFIESGFGFSWTRLTHLGAAFGMAISSAWPCCKLHPDLWLSWNQCTFQCCAYLAWPLSRMKSLSPSATLAATFQTGISWCHLLHNIWTKFICVFLHCTFMHIGGL